jgi:hypothetical protein
MTQAPHAHPGRSEGGLTAKSAYARISEHTGVFCEPNIVAFEVKRPSDDPAHNCPYLPFPERKHRA